MLLDAAPFDTDLIVDNNTPQQTVPDPVYSIDAIKEIIRLLKADGTLSTLSNIYAKLLTQSDGNIFFKSVRASVDAAVRDGDLVQQIIESVDTNDNSAHREEIHLAFSSPSSLCRSTPSPCDQLEEVISRLTPKFPHTDNFCTSTSGCFSASQTIVSRCLPAPEMADSYNTATDHNVDMSLIPPNIFDYGDGFGLSCNSDVNINNYENPLTFDVMDAVTTLDFPENTSLVKQEKENIDYFGVFNRYNMFRVEDMDSVESVKMEPKNSPIFAQNSFYNHFAERADHGISENTVKLGDLVHFANELRTPGGYPFPVTNNQNIGLPSHSIHVPPADHQNSCFFHNNSNNNLNNGMIMQTGQSFPTTSKYNSFGPYHLSGFQEPPVSLLGSGTYIDKVTANKQNNNDFTEALLTNLTCNFPPEKRLLYEAIYVVLRDLGKPLGGHTITSFVRVKCKFLESTTAGLLCSVGRILEEFVKNGIARATPEGLYTVVSMNSSSGIVPSQKPPETQLYSRGAADSLYAECARLTGAPVGPVSTSPTVEIPRMQFSALVAVSQPLGTHPVTSSVSKRMRQTSRPRTQTFPSIAPAPSGSTVAFMLKNNIHTAHDSTNILPFSDARTPITDPHYRSGLTKDVSGKMLGATARFTVSKNLDLIQQNGTLTNAKSVDQLSKVLEYVGAKKPCPQSDCTSSIANVHSYDSYADPAQPVPVNGASAFVPVPQSSFGSFLDLFACGQPYSFPHPGSSQKTGVPTPGSEKPQESINRYRAMPIAIDLRTHNIKDAACIKGITQDATYCDGKHPTQAQKHKDIVSELEMDDLSSDGLPFYKSCGLTIDDHLDSLSPCPPAATPAECTSPDFAQCSAVTLRKCGPQQNVKQISTKKSIIIKFKKIKPNVAHCDQH